jgi:CRP-like cAMP-binding protein
MSVDLLKILKSKGDLPLDLLTHIGRTLRFQSLRKKEFILKPGQVNDKMVFMQNGIVRAYRETDAFEDVGWVKKEGEFIVSISSWYSQRPSRGYVQAIEATDILYITRAELRTFMKTYGEFGLTAFDLLGDVLEEWDDRAYALRRLTADQKIKWLSKNRADLFLRVPAQDLASFLGLSPAHFSRIRVLQNDNHLKRAS